MRLRNLIIVTFLACVVSAYIFPFQFSFFPPSLNTKQIMAVLGILFFVFKNRRDGAWGMDRETVISALIAVAFSIWCYFCMVVNHTDDTTYATYFVSFAVWLGGAYGVYSMLKVYHERVDLSLITRYLTAVSIAQCVIALMIDNIPAVKTVVDTYINQGQQFMDEVNRLYGIGAALDPAGIRFSAVLILLAHLISKSDDLKDNPKFLWVYISAYMIISVIGNMIARTTSVGMLMGLAYILWNSFMAKRYQLTKGQLRTIAVFTVLFVITIALLTYLYNTNRATHQYLRFAFEGFFNWMETGEFRTGSTDKLNSVMWIWPTTTEGWIYGTGIFGNFFYSTDIGYCRFTLYCGLIGLAIFSIFFIWNSLSMIPKFKDSTLLFLMFTALTFIIWLKVATDIFLINALFFCLDGDYDLEDEDEEAELEADYETA